MFPHILAKEGSIGEAEDGGNLLDRPIGGTKIISDVRKRVLRDPLYRRLLAMALADDGEILRSDTQLLGEVLHRTMLHLVLL